MTAIELHFAGETLLSEWLPVGGARATIIVFSTVAGISPLEQSFAKTLNGKGWNVFLADLYGKEYRNTGREVGAQQMRRLSADRAALRDRLLAVVDTVGGLDDLGAGIVAIGFCFGGLCALDLARSGVDVAGVASFHGIFEPNGLPPQPVRAKVIAFHGWDDPMVPPDKVVALAAELGAGRCDWQIHAYGGTVHAFTNPGADAFGNPATRYSERSASRAWRSLDGFLDELFPTNG